MARDERYLAWAVEIARSNHSPKHQHGAVLVLGGNLISTGTNSARAVVPNSHETLHAERDCFWRSSLKEITCNLYVARVTCTLEGAVRSLMDSKPCNRCMAFLIHETRVKKVFWTTDSNLSTARYLNLNHLRRTESKLDSKARAGSSNYRSVRHLAGS